MRWRGRAPDDRHDGGRAPGGCGHQRTRHGRAGHRCVPADRAADDGCGGHVDPGAPVEPLRWGPCALTDAASDAQCATLTVPLDYAHPMSSIDLAVVRLPASGERIGAVVFNPGGPGGSGVEFVATQVANVRDDLWPDLVDGFDLVGFDPRGVAGSGALRCVDDATIDALAYVDWTPDTDEERRIVDAVPNFADACRSTYGDTLRFYDTANTARDMDRLREALGESKLTFYGASYGTLLGATYASLFPDRVRALVLDGGYDPTGDDAGEVEGVTLIGLETGFARWVAWCERTTGCPFGPTEVDARWTALRDRLDATPLRAGEGRPVNDAVLLVATRASMYSRASWPILAHALADADAGDGADLLALADGYSGRHHDGSWDAGRQASAVIRCASGLAGDDAHDAGAVAAALRALSPHFGHDLAAADLVDPCGDLPVGTPTPLAYTGDGPILVVGGANDPVTPLTWAERLAAELGVRAALIVSTGEGHTAFFGSTCVNDAATAVLVTAEAWTGAATCAPDAARSRPSWFDALPTVSGLVPIDLLGGLDLLVPATDAYAVSYVTDLAPVVAADRIEEAIGPTGLSVLDRSVVALASDMDAVRLVVGVGDEVAVVLVIGADALSGTSPLAPLGTLLPGTTLVVVVAP